MHEEDQAIPLNTSQKDREYIEDLIFENKNINALIKGVEGDIEILKKENETTGGKASDIVRFTIELNILQDKKRRNLEAINKIIKSGKQLKGH